MMKHRRRDTPFFYAFLFLFALLTFPLLEAGAQEPQSKDETRTAVSDLLVQLNKDGKSAASTCVVSSNENRQVHDQCSTRSATSIKTKEGLSVSITGGSGTGCTSMTQKNGDSVSACFSNDTSIIQVCNGSKVAPKSSNRRVRRDDAPPLAKTYLCETYINGKKLGD